ncbi:hypothetical protein Fcan01_15891 [Folsomia candida]|uniref:Uncharacterized protein n=1 Tax=Folsomia candida TaxID=158441 RepID=A0A226DYT9_FOLCA|nr:hypothetical protein Fcan01_15891 [Folsomia candida]
MDNDLHILLVRADLLLPLHTKIHFELIRITFPATENTINVKHSKPIFSSKFPFLQKLALNRGALQGNRIARMVTHPELPKSPVSLRTKAMKLCIILCESTVAVFPTLIFILLTFAPCTPPFILSMLPNCQPVQTTLLGRGIQGLIHLYEIWTISHITYSGSIWIFYILFVGIDCMLNYLNLLKRQSFAILNSEDKDNCVRLYCSIQILEKWFNSFVMDKILPCVIICVPALEIVALFVCVNLHQDISGLGFLLFPLVAFDAAMIIILVFPLASWVYKESKETIRDISSKVIFLDNKALTRRQIRSFIPLRVKFGSNFIDRTTALVIQNFVLNRTMTLTLIRSRKIIT